MLLLLVLHAVSKILIFSMRISAQNPIDIAEEGHFCRLRFHELHRVGSFRLYGQLFTKKSNANWTWLLWKLLWLVVDL